MSLFVHAESALGEITFANAGHECRISNYGNGIKLVPYQEGPRGGQARIEIPAGVYTVPLTETPLSAPRFPNEPQAAYNAAKAARQSTLYKCYFNAEAFIDVNEQRALDKVLSMSATFATKNNGLIVQEIIVILRSDLTYKVREEFFEKT